MAHDKLQRFTGYFYGWLVAFTAAMGGFLFGYEIGIINQVFTMHPFKTTFDIETYDPATDTYTKTGDADDITGWVTFTFLIGAAVGALFVYYPCNMLGRKWTIMLGGVSFMVGVAMETVAGNIATLYLGRVVAGMGVGFMSCCVPLYIAETAKTSIRGRLIAVYQFMITIGIFIATCVNSLILKFYGESHGDSEWRLAFGLQFVPCALMLLSLLFLPFSPRWLAYVGRDKEALAVVAQLRGKPDTAESVLEEYEEIMTAVEEEKVIGEGSWLDLFLDPAVRYRTFLAISLQFLQQWTGINIILYFGSDLYAALGFSEDMSNIGFPLINNAVNMVSTLPGMWLIEVIGRKLLMVVGGLGMAVSLALVCVFGEVGDSQGTLDRLGIGAITFILVFTVFFAATWGPVVWVYQSEIFPLRHRAKGTSAGTVSNWTWNAVISKVAPLILADISYYTYLIFAGACVFMALFALVLCPETKGLTLEQVEAVFGQSPAAGRAKKNSAEVELGELAGDNETAAAADKSAAIEDDDDDSSSSSD